MGSEDLVARLVEPSLNAMGYGLVRVRFTGGERRSLQIMAERADGAEMTVEDCASISRELSAVLDVEDPVPGPYTLEVSSPGIDRPLVRLEDFRRFAGFEARVEAKAAIDGRRRFRGVLAGVQGESVLMDVEGVRMSIPHGGISRAKLVLTDDLIAGVGGGGVEASDGMAQAAETEVCE